MQAMAPLLARIALLAVGMGLVEIGLGDALVRGSLAGWGLTLLVGLPLVLAGTAGFIGPLLAPRRDRGDDNHE